jgi:hypothetical protein
MTRALHERILTMSDCSVGLNVFAPLRSRPIPDRVSNHFIDGARRTRVRARRRHAKHSSRLRVLAATNCDLLSAIRSGKFRFGSLLPAERLSNPCPASSRASGRYSLAGQVFHRTLRRQSGQEDSKDSKGDSGTSGGLSTGPAISGSFKMSSNEP